MLAHRSTLNPGRERWRHRDAPRTFCASAYKEKATHLAFFIVRNNFNRKLNFLGGGELRQHTLKNNWWDTEELGVLEASVATWDTGNWLEIPGAQPESAWAALQLTCSPHREWAHPYRPTPILSQSATIFWILPLGVRSSCFSFTSPSLHMDKVVCLCCLWTH